MAETTVEIKFTGDSAFLNAMGGGGAQPVPTTKAPAELGGKPEQLTPNEIAGQLINEAVKASGDTGRKIKDEIEKRQQQFLEQANAIEDLLNGDFFRPIGAPRKADLAAQRAAQAEASSSGAAASEAASANAARGAASAAGGTAGAEAGAAGAAGASATAGIAAGAAVVVVGLLAFGAALKKVNETALESVEKFRDINGTIAATAATIDVNRQLREMRRADNLAPDLAKIATANDKLAGAVYEFGTQGTFLLNKILVAILPMFETLFDLTKQFTAWTASFNAWLATWSSDTTKAELERLDDIAKKAVEDAEKAWKEKDLESGDELEADARRMAEQFLRDFGMGGGGPRIPPTR